MNIQENTIAQIAAELGRLLEPLSEAAAAEPKPVGFIALLEAAEIHLEDFLEDPAQLEPILAAIAEMYETVRNLIRDGLPSLEELPALVQANRGVIELLNALAEISLTPEAPHTAAELPKLVFDHLVVTHLEKHRREMFDFLRLFGIVEPVDPRRGKPAVFDARRLLDWFRDPGKVARETYGWGTPHFDGNALMERLAPVIGILGLHAGLLETTTEERDALAAGPAAGESACTTWQLRIPLIRQSQGGVHTEAGLTLLSLLETAAHPAPGLAVVPFGNGSASLRREIASNTRFDFETNAEATVPFGVVMRPGKLEVRGLQGSTPPPEIHMTAQITRENPNGTAHPLLSHEKIGQIALTSAGLKLQFIHRGETELRIGLPVQGRVRLNVPDGDGFLGQLLPSDGVDAPFQVEAGWSLRHGLYLGGSGMLEVTLPLGLNAGNVVQLESATLGIGIENDAIPLKMTLNARAVLGPFRLGIREMGIRARWSFPKPGGNTAVPELRMDYQPPSGLSLDLDSELFTGGGFLSHDPIKAEYAGTIQLKHNSLVLSGVGILNTRRPDPKPGFSLVLMITGEFPPVQLGFGFSLNGLGGLVGVNRTANIEALQEGVRSGSLDSVLFPKDVVKNAPQILSDLQTFFPQNNGSYLFGPMAQISWGTAPILLGEVGIALELPDPVRLFLFGQLHLGLPSLQKPVMAAHMNLFGSLDLQAGTLAVDAALFDSNLAGYRISGDAALSLRWKKDPDFALAIGGFHPRATPPAGFPELRRVSLNLTRTDNPRLRLEGYVAMTSNTVQCGARLEVHARKSEFSVDAFLSFDTLFQFDPFRFMVDLAAGAAIKAFGRTITTVNLDLRLSGPSPWRAAGTASFRVIWKYTVRFDVTIGDPPPTFPVAKADVRALLIEELKRPTSWTGDLPPSNGTAASLRQTQTGSQDQGVLLVHPQGRFAVRQTLIPLGETLGKFGEKPLKDDQQFEIVRVLMGGKEVPAAPVRDKFAPAQYFEMSDLEKLTAPAYKSFLSGVTIAPDNRASIGDMVHVRPEYEEILIDVDRGVREAAPARATLPDGSLGRLHRRSASALRARTYRDGMRFPGKRRRVRMAIQAR